ncbi:MULTISPECIES: MerR family transcriptional regulator [Microbacterium]|uniref:MerR family transcriptional regulator n=2 Tax=Microbacteriaceae TaxID=85023 RepID=UPI002781801F|nr:MULTISPECIES: MerR family transcriptional regulator [Microbacterium]MDQ1074636.1 DNA-binding transcriptional MerR regulator [Microbacterium sp. SORGH_AS_0969]MDQ1114862.1 DNA-binding transcriptional MerR regulator [Microbacterium testaceum]
MGEQGMPVGETAVQLGLTVRTLHHWDEIGLASPAARSAAGYRLYTDDDLERLRRIVVYRELGLDLDAIRAVLDEPGGDVAEQLRVQRAQLARRIAQLQHLDEDLERMIAAQERGILLSEEEQRATFGPGWDTRWPAEAREAYGGSPQWQQYAERAASRSADDWKAVTQTVAAFDEELGAAIDAGARPGDAKADALVERHREVFSQYFPITRQMQVHLGRMYAADPRFAAHYDAVRPGLAVWLRDAIEASARAHGIDSDTAAWE